MDGNDNLLLASLPPAQRDRWERDLALVELHAGQVLHEPSVRVEHVYWPISAIVSLSQVVGTGATAEVAVVGPEGLVGMAAFLGGGAALSRAVVQHAGRAWRQDAGALKREFDQGAELMAMLLRYAQVMITQTAQSVVCIRHHELEQQVCRWLLLRLDRMHSCELNITQALIAKFLGVRREGVTEVAGRLQRTGVLRYSRGHIVVLDRAALERVSCECYRVIRGEYHRLLAPHLAH